MVEPQIVGNRYRLVDVIGRGGMGLVYRAQDRLNGETVALKRVAAPEEQVSSLGSSVDFRLALAEEFRMLASLRHPHIISVLDYGFDLNRYPYFTMELLDNAQNVLAFGRQQSLHVKLKLVVQVLQALAYLHRRGIIHRDLKPENIQIDGGQVKVLDFGLALARKRINQQMEHDDAVIAGTLAYMPPEVLLGKPADETADLYAVGVIAYELIAGVHPFAGKNVTELVMNITEGRLDMDVLDIDEWLRVALGRLLAKNPAERYTRAYQFIADYASATGEPVQYETVAIRESYLQAAQFIGRGLELNKLIGALDSALRGRGSAWLVGGESGSGKTRLVEELRTHALVNGMMVLRGQAITESGAPYHLWRETLRAVCTQVNLSDFEAGVLKPLVPTIETLIERQTPDAPALESAAAQARLTTVIQSVLHRLTYPTVILLEDLQWAEKNGEDLLLLRQLSQQVADLPLLIVGSYRNDERPNLPFEVPDMDVISLPRLTPDEIADLSASMLGNSVGRKSQITDFLVRETEGNVFFIVEVVRALAEEAGRLADVGKITLPKHIFVGGMQTVVRRRLSRVPQEALPLLQTAAVAGRELDLQVLSHIDTPMGFGEWLYVCEMKMILEVQNSVWRFAHDKLREGLLAELGQVEKYRINETLAQAIEAVHPDDPRWYAALAQHWAAVGNDEKEYFYTVLAGEQAFDNFAYQSVIILLRRAVELAAQLDVPVLRRAVLVRKLAIASHNNGYLEESIAYTWEALILLGRPRPVTGWNFGFRLFRSLVRQGSHRMHPYRLAKKSGTEDGDKIIEIVLNYSHLTFLHYLRSESLPVLYASVNALNFAEKVTTTLPELPRAYAAMAVISGTVQMRRVAEMYIRLALKAVQQVDDPTSTVWTNLSLGVYRAGAGRWQESETLLMEALRISDAIGDSRRMGDAISALCVTGRMLGQYDRVHTWYTQLGVMAQHTGNIQHRIWSLDGHAILAVYQGQHREALHLFHQTTDLLEHSGDLATHILHDGPVGIAHLRLGEYDTALEYAHRTMRWISQTTPTLFSLIEGYAGAAEVYLTLIEQGKGGVPAVELRHFAESACKALRSFAGVFPIGRARAFRWIGLCAWFSGHPKQAYKHWRHGVQWAQELQLTYDEGGLLYEIARHLPDDDPDRRETLQRAADIFEQLQAGWDLEQVQAVLRA